MRKYWLMKVEASECTFEQLYDRPDGIGCWRGVRNYEARNNIRAMKKGDKVLFYQSRCPEPGVSGIAEVLRKPYPDPSAFDRQSSYFDEKSDLANPRWFSVDIVPKIRFRRYVSLTNIKATPELAQMRVVQPGQRLSVQIVGKEEFALVRSMGGRLTGRP